MSNSNNIFDNAVINTANEEKVIENITITYADGTTKEIKKGMIVTLDEATETQMEMTMEMANMTGADVKDTFYAMLQLAADIVELDKEESGEGAEE